MGSRHVPLIAAVLGVFVAASSAEVIVTNLAEPLRATTDIGNNPNPVKPPPGVPGWSWAAQSFTTDATSYSLTKIDMIAGNAAAKPIVIAELRADDGFGQIGPVITTLSTPSFDGPLGPKTLLPVTPVTLAPSTIYWVVIGSQAPGDGTFGLSYANTNNSEGVGIITAYADSQDSGATWNYGTLNPYFIQVVGERTVKCTGCTGDADGSGAVNFNDITTVLSSLGATCR